jgi:putative sigma-54 modulation protein
VSYFNPVLPNNKNFTQKNWIFIFPGCIFYMMKLILSTHNVTLTKTLEDRVVKRLEQLDHMDGRAIDARVTLEHDHQRMPERQFSCSILLAVRGPDLFAEARESDLYAAIDIVTKKIAQQIRKRHSKTKARKHKDAAKLKEAKRAVGV